MSIKLIITNAGPLRTKYGDEGYERVLGAVKALVLADKERGLTTRFIALDDARTLAGVSLEPISDSSSPKQVKNAVDAAAATMEPDYLMLLGAPDVVPYQELENVLLDQKAASKIVLSDLPYACNAPYSTKIHDFLGPTRVVTRLPDVNARKDVEYILKLLGTCAEWSPDDRDVYSDAFTVSADVWKASTKASLEKTAQSVGDFRLSPPDGPQWEQKVWKKRLHYINCHGQQGSPKFIGEAAERPPAPPIAHDATLVIDEAQPGTMVITECCHGTQLYPVLGSGPLPMPNAYLAAGAYGFMGSTTVAWGTPNGTAGADLICQLVLKYLLDGCSQGRALLQARHDYVKLRPDMGPFDLTTIGQFNVLGDPSIHPVAVLAPGATRGDTQADPAEGRSDRRSTLVEAGRNLLANAAYSVPQAARSEPSPVVSRLEQLMDQRGLRWRDCAVYETVRTGAAARDAPDEVRRQYVLFAQAADAPEWEQTGLQAVEVNGEVVSVDEFHRR